VYADVTRTPRKTTKILGFSPSKNSLYAVFMLHTLTLSVFSMARRNCVVSKKRWSGRPSKGNGTCELELGVLIHGIQIWIQLCSGCEATAERRYEGEGEAGDGDTF